MGSFLEGVEDGSGEAGRWTQCRCEPGGPGVDLKASEPRTALKEVGRHTGRG